MSGNPGTSGAGRPVAKPNIPNGGATTAGNSQTTAATPLAGQDQGTITTTVIRPSPGATTEIIIRPAQVNDPNRATTPGKIEIIQVSAPPGQKFPGSPQIQAQAPPTGSQPTPSGAPAQANSAPAAKPPTDASSPLAQLQLQSYPITTFAAAATVPGRSDSAGSAAPAPTTTSGFPSAYSYQSQRTPLPGVRNPIVPDILSGNQGPATANPPGAMTSQNLTSALQDTLLDIQALAEMDLESFGPESGTFGNLANTEHIFIEPAASEFSEGNVAQGQGQFRAPGQPRAQGQSQTQPQAHGQSQSQGQRQTQASFVTSNAFNLLDSYGNRLFYAFEKRKKRGRGCGSFCADDAPIKVAIVGAAGTEVMSITGNSRILSIRETSRGQIGFVSEVQTICPLTSSYLVMDKHGHVAFRILRDRLSSGKEFELHGTDMIRVGHVGKFWGHLPDSTVDMSHSYGISFPKDMNTDEKALLLGALISIYWKYYCDKSRDARMALNAWCCVGYCVIFLILVFLALAVLAAYIIRPA